ncbi:DegV family protein [Kurthia senegalensis]|uniref:DegV family protein n=1 Tax=Kurthia senegalensis TaxID=1033740 RepID=UPI000289180D|nr:DegV family protein [Kurthia senegalensis]
MKKVHIVTDSTSALTKKQIEENNIHVVPLTIYVNGESYQDGENLTPSEFLDEMAKTKELPKSSQPPVGVFQELFDELGANGDDVLVITMTGGMSGTVKSAEAAAQASDANVKVVDSRFISCALGFQVLEAAKMAQEGKTMDEIVKRIEEIRDNTFLYVIVDTLDNLVKGGRIGKGMGMVGSLLNIKPIANLEGGGYNPVAKVRSHKQVVKFLKKQFHEDTDGKTIKGIGIEHANGLAMGEPMLEFFKEEIGFENVHFGVTSPIISTHTGIGAIGLSYYAE